ncbi:alanine racemase [Solibacillus sp. MA9]|uniref:Alanine racemase n=1 Tax=Solibacillus palustris TaxID=2908203 RepID=A0ABS9UD37_9BACL|nr:alanine racemase [Solibacillus sp. MA9]MCH7322248.1 alanine racemase [Solibacillus sp. MA9]
MQKWEMSEVLRFPEHFGTVQEGSIIKVEPNWQSEVNADSIIVKGVYVLKGHMQFDFKENESISKDGIYIEHLDIEKDEAYFEYALPFSIDVPNEEVANIKIQTFQSDVTVNERGQCVCKWEVSCDIQKEEAEKIEVIEQEQPIKVVVEETVVLEEKEQLQQAQKMVKAAILESSEISSEEVDFFDQLAEAYSVVQVQLNASKK